MTKRWLGMVATMAAITLLLGGCGSTSASSATPTDQYVKNRAEWALPTDSYHFSDMTLEGYTTDKLTTQCMVKQGYPEWQGRMYSMQVDGPRSATTNAADVRLFNVPIAQKYGYRQAPDTRIDQAAMQTFNRQLNATTGAEQQAASACTKDADTSLESMKDGAQLGMTMVNTDDIQKDPTVRTAVAAWKKCMAPLGIPDLPEDGPLMMPTPSMSSSFGMDPDGTHGGNDPVTAREIQMATTDAQCRESSGYAEATYNAEWNMSLKAVQSHQSDLTSAKAAADAYRANIMKVAQGG